jgi:serine/threonine-protein kinase HipA
MKYCPITYEQIESRQKYSQRGLRLLSPTLKKLTNFPYSAEEQREEAIIRAVKMSIQGVQAKLSAVLNIKDAVFEVTDRNGRFILKPQSHLYRELPENEDLTMRLADEIGLEVPLHGLIYCVDNKMTYFIRRFDRTGRGDKIALEDFAQLTGQTRDTKYDWTMEKLVPIIEKYCTFPVIEKAKLLKLTIFNFLVGNEDMHLKNFSLITRDEKIELSPCYDLINTTAAMRNSQEEMALPLNGKKRKLQLRDFEQYFSKERLKLPTAIFEDVIASIHKKKEKWDSLISRSFLSGTLKDRYFEIVNSRAKILQL